MDRPRVICHMLMSLDGKIDGGILVCRRRGRGFKKYGELRTVYGCPATDFFGIDSVLLAGGGITNWTFVSRGLVDELSVVLVPTADGDIGAASLFETGDFAPVIPKAFTLKAVEVIENDTLWLRYLLKNKEEL